MYPPKENVEVGDVDKDKVAEEQESPSAPEVHDQGRRKRMCKSGRNCDKKSTCEYSHDIVNKPCRFGDRCHKKEACLFLNENFPNHFGVTAAGNGRSWGDFEENNNNSRGYITDPFGMARPNCGGMHNFNGNNYQGFGSISSGGGLPPQPTFGGVPGGMVPHYARQATDPSCFRNGDGFGQALTMNNNNSSPVAGGATNRLCRDGGTCSSMSTCQFSHKMIQKDCKYGDECKWVEKCLFQHQGRNLQFTNGNRDSSTNNPGAKNRGGRA